MSRIEYLKEIEKLLKNKMPENEIYDITRDYVEFFEEGKKQGKTEEEVMKSLGDPESVVQEILSEEIIGNEIKDKKANAGDNLLDSVKKVSKKAKKMADKTIETVSKTMHGTKNKTENEFEEGATIEKEQGFAKQTSKTKEKTKEDLVLETSTREDLKKSTEHKLKKAFNSLPIIGFIMGFAAFPLIIGLGMLGIAIGMTSLGIVVAVSIASFVLSAKAIFVAVLFSIAVLFFGIGVMLASILMMKAYFRTFFMSENIQKTKLSHIPTINEKTEINNIAMEGAAQNA